MYDLGFLQEFGFSDIQIRIYEYLLKNRFGAIESIKRELNYSYTQVRDNLNYLEKEKLIASSEGKPKNYFRVNPKIALTEKLKRKANKISEKIEKLEEEITIEESKVGICERNITFYHHSDITIGLDYIYEIIDKAEEQIILSSLPPTLLKKLERALYRAFLKGIRIIIYFSKLDFDLIDNYFSYITDLLKNIKAEIIETSEKTCRFIRFNDLIVNEGIILIDKYFNSVLFVEDDYFHFNGFYMPSMAESVANMLKAKTVIKSVEINPSPIQNVLNLIRNKSEIKTRELGIQSKLTGSKLREILEYLIKEKMIVEEIIQGEIGRPKRVYSIIE